MNGTEQQPTSAVSGFLCELRRRKVYRVAAGYAVVGWLIIQVAATLFPALELPSWALRGVILAVLIGFPIALILSWAFDVGPHGFEKTVPVVPVEDCPPALRPKRNNVYVLAAIGLTIAAGVGALVLPRVWGRPPAKSIAVLPFDNFSEDKENEHFADGIQDDVLTSLAKIGDLKVISRTSVTPYKGKARNMKEIGRALGVGAILEGSVRKIGNRVRVNVQLINAETEGHMWAEVYERDLTDVFKLQSELSREIASQLRAKLSPGEKARINDKPTENADAYLLFTQARALATGSDTEERKKAIPLFEQAIALDPGFALAYAQLSQLQSWIYFSIDPTKARLEKAREAANEAIRLDPDLPEAHLALGHCYYYGERDYARALAEFETARRGLPNDASVYRAIGAIARRQGKWQEAIKHYKRAVSLNPKDATLMRNYALNYQALRDWPTAAKLYDQAVALAPDDFEIKSLRAWIDVYWKGDFTRFHELLASAGAEMDKNPVAALARFNVQLFERRFDEALSALAQSPLQNMRGETSAPLPKSFLAGQIYDAMNDKEKARAAFEEARPIAERALAESPDDASRHVLVGLIYAGLGRKEEALREGCRAVELLPESKDAFNGPILTISLARIQTLIGNHEDAIALLERSLATPNGITVSELRLEPTWDPLRDNARFQKLLGDKKSG